MIARHVEPGYAAPNQILSVGTDVISGIGVPTAMSSPHRTISLIFRSIFRMRNAWVAVGIVYLLDAIWSEAIGFTLSGCGLLFIVLFVLLGGAAIARSERPGSRAARAAEVAALWLAFATACNILSYLLATLALSLRDEPLASADNALGFQWVIIFQWVSHHPLIHYLLSASYQSLTPETIVLAIWLSWERRDQQVQDFFWIAYLAGLQTSILSALVPAAGAFVQYGEPDRAVWLHDLTTLRSGSNLHFVLAEMTGIVTFPSFHTVLAMLAIYIARGSGAVGCLFVVWNVIMLLAIPSIGGHYFVDMIGGGIVLATSIGLVRCMAHRAAIGKLPTRRRGVASIDLHQCTSDSPRNNRPLVPPLASEEPVMIDCVRPIRTVCSPSVVVPAQPGRRATGAASANPDGPLADVRPGMQLSRAGFCEISHQ
jgi:hypothetical protein